MVATVLRAAGRKPAAMATVMYYLTKYAQVRLMLDTAEQSLGRAAPAEALRDQHAA